VERFSADAARGNGEAVSGTPVGAAVEGHEQPLGGQVAVATANQPPNGRRIVASQAGADVQGVVSIEEANLRALRRGGSFDWFPERESLRRCGLGPFGFVKLPIDPKGGALHTHCRDTPRGSGSLGHEGKRQRENNAQA
jgi:hypothetical protein